MNLKSVCYLLLSNLWTVANPSMLCSSYILEIPSLKYYHEIVSTKLLGHTPINMETLFLNLGVLVLHVKKL